MELKQDLNFKMKFRIPEEERICNCGCNQKFICKIYNKKRFIRGHNSRTIFHNTNKGKLLVPREERICACGCTEKFICKINDDKKYILGHQTKGKSYRKGKKVSKETIEKLILSHIGQQGYWTNKHRSEQTKNKIKIMLTGHKLSEETKIKIGLNNKGSKHWNWRGGKSLELYGIEFNKQLKEFIRNRDNHKCQLCGVPEIECLNKLNIHHIDYNKKNNNIKNLISLCKKCHSKTNKHREYYMQYLNNLNDKSVGKGIRIGCKF